MKNSLFILLFCGSLLCISQTTFAQNSGFGIGAIINSPNGLSAKAWVSDNLAVDGAFTFSISENFSQIYFHSDVLQHSDAITAESLELYYGLGIRLLWDDLSDDLTAGLRGPIGTEYSFEGSNIKSFLEIAPTLDFTNNTSFFFTGALGMRVYLN